ncbi:MAG: replication initiator protein A [Campylobacter sp.]|uniref:hypothetical protein n=1 Tax=Campylobacter sp. TaxID=205 RepID=UPI002AA7B9E6|nr:hypothetical protein [Campylobacter sp.]MCI7549230.1 replication initiator protein A [Campylobacter sp.]
MSYFKYYFDTSDLKLSLGAEKLLNIFRDRYELSAKTGFTGKNGNVVFLIKLDEIASLLGKSKITAFRMVDELRQKGLISTQKRQSGILEFSLNVNFNIIKNDNMDIIKNDNSIHISQTKQARLTKPNARMRTHEASQSEPSQNQLSEATSRHSFSGSELGNSRISSGAQTQTQAQTQTPSKNQTQSQAQGKTQTQDKTQAQTQTQTQDKAQAQTQTQDKKQEPKTARQWLGINDKPSYISEQTWQDFCAYKRERRHNFTATGKKAFFAKLDDIEAKSGACEQAIKNTMANGWQGVFMPPLDKSLGKGQAKGQAMKPAQMVDALQEWLSDRQAQVIESVESQQGEQELPQALPSKRRA